MNVWEDALQQLRSDSVSLMSGGRDQSWSDAVRSSNIPEIIRQLEEKATVSFNYEEVQHLRTCSVIEAARTDYEQKFATASTAHALLARWKELSDFLDYMNRPKPTSA
jgi:hypothetical protein